MTHSFRFTDEMENELKNCKVILSNLTSIPVSELSDTSVILFALHRVSKDYSQYLVDSL